MRPSFFASTLWLIALSACGGKDSTGPTNDPPTHAFPAVAGVYSFTATFDDFTPAEAHAAGTVTIAQVSRDAAGLTGSMDFTTTIGGDVNHGVAPLSNASVSPQGVLSFAAGDTEATWTFTGTVSGTSVSGRHSLSDGVTTFSGNWTGSRSASAAAGFLAVARSNTERVGRLRRILSDLTLQGGR